jgi:glycosyltransferase involved in cell wall biosynthesis
MTKSRKVVFVGNFGLWRKGTMGSRALPMARELRAAGHEAVLVVPPWDAPEEADSVVRPWDVPVRNVPIRRGPARHPGIVIDLLRATVAERPDVVVSVKAKAYAGLIAQVLRGVRVVVDVDDDEAGWSALAGDPLPVRAFVQWHERAVIRRADSVIAASRALDRFVTSLGAHELTYLPNGTWPGSAAWPRGDGSELRTSLGLGDAPTVLLYSRLFEFSLERLMRVLTRVADAVPAMRILVVGTGLMGEEQRLRTALRTAGLLERAVLIGWVKREDLPNFLAAGDVAVVPMDDTAVNRARCSVKLLDLMLSGRAIVADAVGQASEYLRDDQIGRLVRPEDAEAMAEAATGLLRDPSTARRLGDAADATARSQFTWEQQREKLVGAVVGD